MNLEPPIIVGHSVAGLIIPVIADRRPVRELVFLCPMMAKPGLSVARQRAAEPIDGLTPLTTAEWTDLGNDVWMVRPTLAV